MSLHDLGQRIVATADTIVKILSTWDEVEAVCVLAYGDDRYDPYLALSIDAYVTSEVRPPSERQQVFSGAGAFESSLLTRKDRFLMDETPVRVEYKRTGRIDTLVSAAREGRCQLREAGTLAFFRLSEAVVLFSRNGWVESARSGLEQLPDGFWGEVQESQRATIEHVFGDLQAACAREDSFYFSVAAGRFAARAAAALFAARRLFEPSPRMIGREVLRLPDLPPSFEANIEHLSRVDSELSMVQRCEIAGFLLNELMGALGYDFR